MFQKTKLIKSDESSETLAVPAPRLELAQFVLSPSQREALEHKNNLLRLYNTYKQDYLKYYIENLEEEHANLQTAFKNVDFYIMSRLKSKHSYIEKLNKKGEALDIFGDKIIILAVDGKTDENLLIQKAYEMENFLITHNPYITEVSRKRKDYIAKPKENSYSSLHTTRVVSIPKKDIKFYRETQIKTFRMRETEKSGTAGHSSVYKNDRNLFLEKIASKSSAEYYLPQYMHFEFDKNTRKSVIILDDFEANFKYYFGINFDEFMQLRAIQLR